MKGRTMRKTRLVLASQKGGVGKTTICLNLADALARQGFKTVLIDLDPQGGLIFSLGGGNFEFAGLTEVLVKKKTLSEVLIPSNIANLSLLSKGKLHTENIPRFENTLYRDDKLAEILTQLEEEYDYIIMDPPTGLSRITRTALRMASQVLLPLQVDISALRSLHQILQLIDYVQREENPYLQMLGIVLNMMEDNPLCYQVAQELWRHFPFILPQSIPRSAAVIQASLAGIPVSQHNDKHMRQCFSALASHIHALVMGQVPNTDQQLRYNREDLEQARHLATNICQRQTRTTQAALSTTAPSLAHRPTRVRLPAPPVLSFKEPQVYREEVWTRLLQWVVKVADLQRAFIMDERGLLVASYGQQIQEGALEIDVLRLMSHLEHALQRSWTPDVLQVKMGEQWFCAFYLPPHLTNLPQLLVACLVGRQSVDSYVRTTILSVLQDKLRDLATNFSTREPEQE